MNKNEDNLIWNDVETTPPPNGKFVLTKSPSGYTTCKWVYRTAWKFKDYHDNAWITEGHDNLMDEGLVPVAWAFLDHNK